MTSFPPTPGLTLNPESPYKVRDFILLLVPYCIALQSASHPANHGLRHTTIRQVLNAVHVRNHFEIDGRETEFVSLRASHSCPNTALQTPS